MQFVVVQNGVAINYPEIVEVIDLDELEADPDAYYELSDEAQQYLLAEYSEYVPEEIKLEELN